MLAEIRRERPLYLAPAPAPARHANKYHREEAAAILALNAASEAAAARA